MRFPELSLTLRNMGAEILTYPSAFTYQTGAAHWEMILRTRAVENQCYVVAAAQTGAHNKKRVSWGHAMVDISSRPPFLKLNTELHGKKKTRIHHFSLSGRGPVGHGCNAMRGKDGRSRDRDRSCVTRKRQEKYAVRGTSPYRFVPENGKCIGES